MIYTVSVLALLAAVLHVFIFYLEVFAWEQPLARKIFGAQDSKELEITRFYAYNQGVYNLALAIIACVGAFILPIYPMAGLPLVLAGCGSMLLAALALGLKSSRHRAAAIKQGTLPALAVIAGLTLFVI